MQFEGTYTALVTPFQNGEVDIAAYRRLLDMQKAAGVTGVVPCGCTGEAATLSDKERRHILDVTLDVVGDDVAVIAGTGTNSTDTTIANTKEAERAGAHGAMLITPYYNKPSQDGLVRHYRQVGDATALPLVLYNVPGRTAVTLAPATIATLFMTGRYPAIKEAAGSVDAVSSIRAECDITILSGDDSLTVPMMSVGAKGAVSVVSNLFPDSVRDMVAAALAGDFGRASDIHFRLLPVMRAAFIESNPSPIKAMLALKAIIEDDVRAPLAKVSDESLSTIRKVLEMYSEARSV